MNEDVYQEGWKSDFKEIVSYLGDNLTADLEKIIAEYQLSLGE